MGWMGTGGGVGVSHMQVHEVSQERSEEVVIC